MTRESLLRTGTLIAAVVCFGFGVWAIYEYGRVREPVKLFLAFVDFLCVLWNIRTYQKLRAMSLTDQEFQENRTVP